MEHTVPRPVFGTVGGLDFALLHVLGTVTVASLVIWLRS
jgi:hypothetical protein